MKIICYMTFLGGLIVLALAFGFILQIPFVTHLWPWTDGRLSYLFIGSILAAVSVAAVWIGWAGELGALPAGSLNIFIIAVTSAVFFLQPDRVGLLPFGLTSILIALASGFAFLWSRRLPLRDSRPTPWPVRISFGIFVAVLLLTGSALILQKPIFPWKLNPDSSVIFGCIFIGDAFYLLYGLLVPLWHNAKGQLLSFLAYDLVLIVPFIGLFQTIDAAYHLSLIVYVAVLIYSGGLAVYYLFFNTQTRGWTTRV
jgi:hypothetical protein